MVMKEFTLCKVQIKMIVIKFNSHSQQKKVWQVSQLWFTVKYNSNGVVKNLSENLTDLNN